MSEELVIVPLQPQYELKVDVSSVQLNFAGRSKLIAQHLKAMAVQAWVPQSIGQVYKTRYQDACFIFQQRYVLTTIDHSSLTSFLEECVKGYFIYDITYPPAKYEGQVQMTLNEMHEGRLIIPVFADKLEGVEQRSILIRRSSKEQVELRLAVLKNFQEQVVIYPLDEYLQNSKLNPTEYRPFVEGLLFHYHDTIKHYLRKQLEKYGLEQDLLVTDVLASYELQQLDKARIKHGVALSIIAYDRALPKAYQILQRWFEKANWIVLEVEQIQCCPREKIRQWFLEKRRMKAVLVSTGANHKERANCERVVVFAPKMDKPHLQRELCSAIRLITGKQFNTGGKEREGRECQQDNRFHLIYKYKREFKRFMAGERGGQSNLNLQVYQEYILVDCDPLTESRVRDQIKKFLELYEEEESPIPGFTSSFHIAIFKHFYSSSIRTKPINLYVENNRLIRHNSKQISEQAETQISEIYKRMRRELVFKPLSKPLPIKKDYLDISTAPPDWMTPECLQSRRYNVGDKLTIYVRSYGSLTNGDEDCIFLVEDFEKCTQLKEILQQEEVSRNFEEVLKKNKSIKMSLRYCRYFDNIIVWFLGKERHNRRGASRNNRFQDELGSLFGNTHNQMSFKFMLSTGSEALVEILLPSLLETLLKSCNFERGVRKEVTFYTSCRQGPSLRSQLIDQLRRFSRQAAIDRVTDLDLHLQDIEKIIEYKYIELKYYDNEVTKCASPLNSFVFSREVLKKGKTPIFLPSEDCRRYCEYLVSYFAETVYEIREGRIAKLNQGLRQMNQLNGLAVLIKRYFPMLDYVVLYGRLDKGVFSQRLLYTESREEMYQQFLELELETAKQKILLKQKGRRIRYKIVSNEFLQLYRVQTHPNAVAELENLKKCVVL